MSVPRVLLSNAPFHHRRLEDAFAVAAEAGFDGVELMVTGDPVTQDAAAVAAIAAAHRLPVPVVHGPFLLLTRRVLGTDPLEKAARTCVMAAALGADLVIVHPPFRWQHEFRTWLRTDADRVGAAHGLRIAVENLYPVPLGPATPRLHTATHPEHLVAHRHVVLDTSHLAVTGIDLGRAWDVVGTRPVPGIAPGRDVVTRGIVTVVDAGDEFHRSAELVHDGAEGGLELLARRDDELVEVDDHVARLLLVDRRLRVGLTPGTLGVTLGVLGDAGPDELAPLIDERPDRSVALEHERDHLLGSLGGRLGEGRWHLLAVATGLARLAVLRIDRGAATGGTAAPVRRPVGLAIGVLAVPVAVAAVVAVAVVGRGEGHGGGVGRGSGRSCDDEQQPARNEDSEDADARPSRSADYGDVHVNPLLADGPHEEKKDGGR